MATRTTTVGKHPRFVASEASVRRMPGGAQIDWANVAVGYKDASGYKFLPAGTAVGSLLGSGKVSPRVVTTNPAIGLLESDAYENSATAPLSGYGIITGGDIYESLLPDATGGPPPVIAAGIKTELVTNAATFLWYTYVDTR